MNTDYGSTSTTLMFEGLSESYPPLDTLQGNVAKHYLEGFPDDYRAFLAAHNGGFADAFRYTFLTGVPFKSKAVSNSSRDDCPIEFFGLPQDEQLEGYPDSLLHVAADHAQEGFLPNDVVAIARCVQSSLVCLSRREDDFGSVYYWDWYWQYPWCEAFFRERINAARQPYDEPNQILGNSEHPQHTELRDALNFATLLKVAPSFSAWAEQCEDRRDRD
ncbi:MAG: SMI1/KNR4 family protein [Gammaproteobacteria bacterium]